MIWITRDRRRLPLTEMSDDHLRNAVAMLIRSGVSRRRLRVIAAMKAELDWRMKSY